MTDLEHALDQVDAYANVLQMIRTAIRDYHFALDMRQHGGVAQDRAFHVICGALGMYWTQGEEAGRRALEAVKGEQS
ncbi:MAG TPA: hypothetical protein VF783_13820 [Terriglobales bacterium]